MKFLKKILLPPIISLIIIFFPVVVNAQPDPRCDPDCPWIPDCPPECIPFDGGLFLLIAAGIGIGAKKAYDEKIKLL